MGRVSVWIAVVLAACGTPTSEPVRETETETEARLPEPALEPEAAPATCDDAARVRRAAQVALDAARAEGLDAAVLEGCDAALARCGDVADPPLDAVPIEAPPARCTVAVSTLPGAYWVRVTPAARDGAPIGIEAWIDGRALPPPGRLGVARTRWAMSRDGALLIVGVPEQVSHTHGGPPARIGRATFRITNRRDVPVPLAVARVEWLGVGAERGVPAISVTPDVVPPGTTTEVEVLFAPQPAYLTWSERFASRVTLRVAGAEEIAATVEHHVLRREPLRR